MTTNERVDESDEGGGNYDDEIKMLLMMKICECNLLLMRSVTNIDRTRKKDICIYIYREREWWTDKFCDHMTNWTSLSCRWNLTISIDGERELYLNKQKTKTPKQYRSADDENMLIDFWLLIETMRQVYTSTAEHKKTKLDNNDYDPIGVF